MTRRRAMSLLEVLLAAAMLAMIAAALTGLGRTAVVAPSTDSEQSDPETFILRASTLREMDPLDLEDQILPGEQLTRFESEPVTPGQSASGEWIIIKSEAGILIRWLPATEKDEGRAQ